MFRLLQVLSIVLLSGTTFGQDWVRIYGQGQSTQARWVIEDYDKGYDILGMIGSYKYGWIQKTDINGYELWEKWFGSGGYQVWSRNIERTTDNRYIICGSWTKFNTSWDAFLIKLNACYEVEWCKTLITPTNFDKGIRVKVTPEGDIVLFGAYFLTDPISNLSLFKFTGEGDLIWHQFYPMDSIYYDDQPHDLLVDSDGYLITADRYYPDPGTTNPAIIRSFFIKTDTSGSEVWSTVYIDSGSYYSRPRATIKNEYGHYYNSCTHTNYGSGDNPALIKVLHDGVQSYNHDIINTGSFNLSGMNTINILHDTNFILAGGWVIDNVKELVIIKTDTLGNLRKTKLLPLLSNTYIATTKTFDNKFVTVGNDATGGWKVYAVKVNSDLEYDSIYTQPFTYDSLCPYPIVSTTVDPDCDNVYVGVEEPFKDPETTKLKIYPNPAKERLTIELPKYLVLSNTTGRIPSVTVYHHWGSTLLEAYDLYGRKLMERVVLQADRTVEVDVSQWPRGMYVFRLNYRGETVASEKVVVE